MPVHPAASTRWAKASVQNTVVGLSPALKISVDVNCRLVGEYAHPSIILLVDRRSVRDHLDFAELDYGRRLCQCIA